MVERSRSAPNPFSVTKANDFTDEQIRDFWVDYQDEGGFLSLFAPQDPMPKLLLGGKGSGKTHLMRYYSFPLQVLRATDHRLLDQIQVDRYAGIYTRCGGLDSSRFSGKSQDADTWGPVFAYYMELWLSYHVISLVARLLAEFPNRTDIEIAICKSVMQLFDCAETTQPKDLSELKQLLRGLQRRVDLAVNNAAITRTLDLTISVSPGRLVFGVPREVARHAQQLSSLSFVYLIDELELLTEDQQRFINTLVRDREPPVTFRLGARTYGIKTYATLAAREENRPGSEFDRILLDEHLRQGKKGYQLFARRLIAKRLQRAGIAVPSEDELDQIFEAPPRTEFWRDETAFVHSKGGERRYFSRLREQLTEGLERGLLTGVQRASTIREIIDLLRVPDAPLLEKVNVLLLYRSIKRRTHLLLSATEISQACAALREQSRQRRSKYEEEYRHFAFDLFAQLCREYDQPVRYIGLPEFIQLSDGLPRSLLIILKNIYKWAEFSGERPLHGDPISQRAQERGVLEASDWFFREAPLGGGEAAFDARKGVERLAELFRELVYSHKPPECSLITFATDLDSAGDLAQARIQTAQEFSLLVRIVTGQKDKNTGRVDEKYQLNRMLAPRWGLPVARRGAISLSPREVMAIFCPGDEGTFLEAKGRRVARTMFPFELNAPIQASTIPLFGSADDD